MSVLALPNSCRSKSKPAGKSAMKILHSEFQPDKLRVEIINKHQCIAAARNILVNFFFRHSDAR